MANLNDLLKLTQQRRTDEYSANQQGGNDLLTQLASIGNNIKPADTDMARAITGFSSGVQTGNLNTGRMKFMQGLQEIAQSQISPEEKINAMVGLKAQHGQDYGFGIDDIVKQYGDMAKTNATANKGVGQSANQDVQSLADGIEKGLVAPDPAQVSFRDRTPVNAELTRRGFNLQQANQEWKATQKFLSSMNSEKQIRLRQAISSVTDALDNIDKLNNEYQRTGYSPINKAKLAFDASTGNELAARYIAQLSIIQDELAQVYMGGNSPTERALDLAGKMMKGDYSVKQLNAVLGELRNNLRYRVNAINSAEPYGGNQVQNKEPLPTQPGSNGGPQKAVYAVNPKTKTRIMSMDGGQTWQQA